MKKLIRKWLDIQTREEIEAKIKEEVMKRANSHYSKLRKADKDRYKELKKLMEKENE